MAKEKFQPAGKGLIIRTYKELAAALKSNQTSRLYVLFGEEEYLIDRAVNALTRLLIAPGCKDADSYTDDWSSGCKDPESLMEMVRTPPFLSEKRMIIIRKSGLFSGRSPESPDVCQKYISLFSGIPDSSCLIFVEEKVDKRKKVLLEAAAQKGMLVQIDRQNADELCRWAGSILQKEKIKITMEAINSLVDRTEGSMRVLAGEIQKLVLYCAYTGVFEITIRNIDLICIPDIRGSIFQMTDSIGSRNIGRALSVLDTLIAMKEPIPKIRFMLSRHLRQLICAKELGTPEKTIAALKVVPFVARNLISQSKYFRMSELTDLFEACAQSDFSVKTGQIDDRFAMETLLVSARKAKEGQENY